jgi:Zn-dependent M28 family amino/carboxypeptidase
MLFKSTFLSRISFALLCVLVLGAAGPASQRDVTAQVAAPESSIRAEDVLGHIRYLAGDSLEGRGSGTEGARRAARYIADHFRAARLRPMGSRGSYFQEFPFTAGVKLGPKNTLEVRHGGSRKQLKLGEEFMTVGLSSTGRASAPIVFVGYGIRAPELKHDDYAGVDVRGKIVLVLRSAPDGDDPHGRFGPYVALRSKAATARDQGAAGILFVTGPLSELEENVSAFRVDSSFADAGLPAALIRRDRVEELLQSAGRDLRALQTELAHGAAKSFPIPDASAALTTSIARERRTTENVLGFLEGSDPKLRKEVLVIGAHYDHLGRGGEGSLETRDVHGIHHGADDNASGTAGVIELARYLAARRDRSGRSVLFAAFSGEELGLLGSSHFVKNSTIPLDRVVAMINMDMIGRMKDDRVVVIGSGTSPAWKELLDSAGKTHALTVRTNASGFGASDQTSFYARHIPVLFFFTGVHSDYHRTTDTWEKINAVGEARLLGLIADISERICGLPERPLYARADSGEPSMPVAFRVYLGTIPDYAEEREGVTLQGVRENSPAEKAGLRAGDVIVEFDGKKIRNVYDYTYVLRDASPGKPVPIVVLRGSKRETLTITPARPPS